MSAGKWAIISYADRLNRRLQTRFQNIGGTAQYSLASAAEGVWPEALPETFLSTFGKIGGRGEKRKGEGEKGGLVCIAIPLTRYGQTQANDKKRSS